MRESDSSDEEDNVFMINEIKRNADADRSWTRIININNKAIRFKIDTGADVNVLPYKNYLEVASDISLEKHKAKVIAYGE